MIIHAGHGCISSAQRTKPSTPTSRSRHGSQPSLRSRSRNSTLTVEGNSGARNLMHTWPKWEQNAVSPFTTHLSMLVLQNTSTAQYWSVFVQCSMLVGCQNFCGERLLTMQYI